MAQATKTKSTKNTKAAAPAPVEETVEATETEEIFGVAQIADLIKAETGKVVKTRDLRILLRKMARDGRLDREIVAGNRARWEFAGADDPDVEKVLEAYRNGELEADKKEKLDALKKRKADEKARKAAEKAAEEAEEGDDEELVEE